MTLEPQLNIAIVAPIAQQNDAISMAVRDTFLIVTSRRTWRAIVLTTVNEFEDIEARLYTGPHDLLLDRAFNEADVLIYHVSMYDYIM
jgi:hypothetical protein